MQRSKARFDVAFGCLKFGINVEFTFEVDARLEFWARMSLICTFNSAISLQLFASHLKFRFHLQNYNLDSRVLFRTFIITTSNKAFRSLLKCSSQHLWQFRERLSRRLRRNNNNEGRFRGNGERGHWQGHVNKLAAHAMSSRAPHKAIKTCNRK